MERSGQTERRDGLGLFCFWLHVAVLCFIVTGWALPGRGLKLFYLLFLPLVALQWLLNRGACVLNNLENRLRHGRWRAPERNAEEGAWLRTLIRRQTGIDFSRRAMDVLNYSALALFWAMAWAHLAYFQVP